MATNFVTGPFWNNGPSPGGYYHFPGSVTTSHNTSKQHTLSPTTTGTSVLGITFNGGVIIAADMLGSYGSMARFRDCPRVMKVNETTVMGASGDYADYQFLKSIINQRVIDDELNEDGFNYTPKTLFSWCTRILYNRRSRFNPLWNTLVIGGLEGGAPFLGYIDKIGTAFQAPSIATGYGAYIAQPLLRDALEKTPEMTEAQAVEVIERCLRVLFYRDARSFNKYQLAIITAAGVRIEGPKSAQTNWEIASMVKGYE